MVYRVGAAVAKKCATRDRESEMVNKQPAIFLRVNDQFRLVRDALGPCYCVRARSNRECAAVERSDVFMFGL